MKIIYFFTISFAVLLSIWPFQTVTGWTVHWEPIGPQDDGITCLYFDKNNQILFAGTLEGFWYYDIFLDQWTQREDEGWIGRTVWSIISHNASAGTIITGRENAFFKGYVELSTDWGVSGDIVYSSQGGSVKDVKNEPGADDVFYACTWSDVVQGELIKSIDGGNDWTLLTGYIHHAMTEIAVDPLNPLVVYVSGSSQVTKSTDGGGTWSSASSGLPTNLGIYCVSISPEDPQTLLASNDNGIYRTTDGGGQWNYVEGTPTCQHFAFNAADPDMVAGVTFSPYRVLVSRDKGLTWVDWSGDFAGQHMTDLAFSEDGGTLYVASVNEGVFQTLLPDAVRFEPGTHFVEEAPELDDKPQFSGGEKEKRRDAY